MITVQVAGNVGKADAEIRSTRNGDSVTTFSVAGTAISGGKKKTEWFNCSIWGERGEKLAQYITSGSAITVSGELSTREWEARDKTMKTSLEIRVSSVKLQGGGGRGDGEERGGSSNRRASKPAFDQDLDDEVPF